MTDYAVVTYLIHTNTGFTDDSATESDVYVNLVGELGDMGNRQLLRSNNTVKFQQGQV